MKNDHDIFTDFDGLTQFNGFTNFTKQIAEKLDEAFVKTLEEYGFHKDYLETSNSEFSIHVWPHANGIYGAKEQFGSSQYDVYRGEEKLFTVYVIVKNYLSNDGGHSEIILDIRKCKELPFSENITGEEMSK